MRGFALACLILLAGCSQSGQDVVAPDEGEPQDEVEDPQPVAPGNETEPGNAPPVARLEADVLEGRTPFNVTFLLYAHDADNDTLHWNLSVGLENGTLIGWANGTFGGANGTSGGSVNGTSSGSANGTDAVRAMHNVTFAAGGNHTAVLTVTDGHHTVNATLLITATDYVPLAFDVEDPAMDSAAGPVDVLRFRGWIEGDGLELRIHVDDLPPASDSDTSMVWRYRVWVGDHQFQNFNFVGPQTWDTTNGNYIGGTSWDPDADVVSMRIPLEILDGLGLVAPYDVKMESGLGHLSLGPHVPVDQAPDTGTVQVG